MPELGLGLRAVSWSPDGLIEAIEDSDGRFVLGVQWHAETLIEEAEELALFERLVESGAEFEAAPRPTPVRVRAAPRGRS